MRKRNIDKIPRGRRKPVVEAEKDWSKLWTVKASEVAGSPLEATFFDEEQARKHAEWWFSHPGIVGVELLAPVVEQPALVKRYIPSAEDEKMGGWLAAALDDPKVCPTMKFDINRWLDSRAWGYTPKETA